MNALITDADRLAALLALAYATPPASERVIADVAQAIADTREQATNMERSACVRELRARAAQARSDGWDMVENGLALAAVRIELGVDR